MVTTDGPQEGDKTISKSFHVPYGRKCLSVDLLELSLVRGRNGSVLLVSKGMRGQSSFDYGKQQNE